ncbi:AGE family epimerase/isomerase [Aureibacter tunicatorum]|uniref:Mannose/cellobiose epimerase-like protein (N-acyl-D-glucosamine 2-epimerase family) n=1 Tax=Aureibacter tunicatorum TaxID=866807 RepID=A0AAE4BSG2_9BACT|nr:AGE family epimerase/isomerase [Aureibacter tunicatorum]MDR6238813.1 mannose/cellobiose epimerase-like protein (N-acyl-D-glucosamine 2-epimerase family) [Aureibacter tunicatorum]
MKKIVFLTMAILAMSCQKAENSKEGANENKTMDIYLGSMENLIDFFDRNAYDSALHAYYSDLDNEGNLISKRIYNVALSRLIYGLAYSSKFFPKNLDKAKQAANFQMLNLVDSSDSSSFFYSFVEKGEKEKPLQADIWQQAYGLCGLTELYRNAPDKRLLSRIHMYHHDFVEKFKDDKYGGFYSEYSFEGGQVSGSKTLQALMYPITAYMYNLWTVDTANREKYEPILKENLLLAKRHAWNAEIGWVNVKFDDQWRVCTTENDENPCFTVTPGHNFQLASAFLRAKDMDIFSPQERKEFEELGFEIIDSTLKKSYVFFAEDLSEGFVSEVNPLLDAVLNDRKTWWQHCEALIAMSLCGGKYEEQISQLKKFFFKNFPDFEHGGEYFFIDKNNQPIKDELKGSIGKSTYHTIEMIRYLKERE